MEKVSEKSLLVAPFLLLLLANFIGSSGSEAAKLRHREVASLKAIGDKLGKRDWNFSVDPCSGNEGWITPRLDQTQGNNVTCDCTFRNRTVCHVVSIVLRRQNLNGSLPDELKNLTHLSVFDVSRNYINGTIPASWGSLRRLDNLTLLGNRVSGRIPKEIGNLSHLTVLVVEGNKLEGTLPPELGKLTNIKRLYLNSNKFTGELPSSLANLTNMKDFWISGSNFTGKIPDFIKNWNQLNLLMIMGTSMEGPIPSSISSLVQLTKLRIADLNGPGSNFPPLENLTELQELVLRNCSLSGEIPPYIGSMKRLKILDLSFNSLTGQVPTSLSSNAPLGMIFLRNNKLNGSLPEGNIQTKNLDLSENTFAGASPPSCPQNSVNFLSSYSSTYDNSVPACFRKDYPCPDSPTYSSLFINCGGPEYTLNGTTYEADMDQRGMSTCRIQNNLAFTSTGTFMDAPDNPYLVSNTSRMLMRDPTVYMTARTSPITMTYYGLCLQKGNYTVRLHFSEMMFTNDETFGSLGERVFDVYIQHKRVLEDFNIASEAGGVGKEVVKRFIADVTASTLEISFYWAGKGTLSIPTRGVYGPLVSAISVTPNFVPKVYIKEDTKPKHKIIVAIFIVSACIVCVVISLLVILKVAGFLGGAEDDDKELENLDLQSGRFSIREVKVATSNFHRRNKIGEGGFGPVYKGTLRDGTPIAVKKLSSLSKQGNREFLNEIGIISALQHPNLVQLFGFCISGSQLMLIYEYVENNSLARALFGPVELRLKLNWPTRCNICIGIAKGLAYLHEESTLKVVHRDIKATNILLDKDLNAKITDFGFAKLDEGDNTHISTRIAGTAGYIAPEYATRGHLTDKADVFSFGVVTLEIVSGQSNSRPSQNEEFSFLLDEAYVLEEKGSLLKLVDPSLGSEFSKEAAWKIIKVALLCTRPSPLSRPKMSSVVHMLEGREPVPQIPLDTTFSRAFSSITRSSNNLFRHRMTGSDLPTEIRSESLSIPST